MSIPLPLVYDAQEGAYIKRIHPLDSNVSLTLQPLSTVTMTLPQIDDIKQLDWVQLQTPDGSVGYYRVSSVTTNAVNGEKDVYMEHGACLLDNKIIPESTGRNSIAYHDTVSVILSTLLTGQNRWTVGTVQSSDVVYIEPGGMSVMTAILTMMQSIPDYQIEFVQASESDWHIDIKARPTTPICEGRLNRNLQSCDISYTTDGMCTRLYADGTAHDSTAAIQQYGLFEQTVTLNENLSPEQKGRIISAYLNMHDHPAISISISGLELSQITGLSIDQFELGTVCRIAIPWLDIVQNEVIVDKRYSDPFNNPEDVKFTLANETPDLSITVAAITGGGGGGGGIGSLGSAGKGGLEGEKKRFQTKFEQTDQYFRLLATETEYDELENGTVTAYSQLVTTSTSIQAVVEDINNSGYSSITQLANFVGIVVTKNGDNGSVNTASITAAINGDNRAEVRISANKTYIDGQTQFLATALGNTLNCVTLSSITTAANTVSTSWLTLNSTSYMAYWRSMQVCTGVQSRDGNNITELSYSWIYYVGHY